MGRMDYRGPSLGRLPWRTTARITLFRALITEFFHNTRRIDCLMFSNAGFFFFFFHLNFRFSREGGGERMQLMYRESRVGICNVIINEDSRKEWFQ